MTSLPVSPSPREAEWQSRLLACVSGLLLFETLSGLSSYLLPFSVTNQITVLVQLAPRRPNRMPTINGTRTKYFSPWMNEW